MKIFRLYHKADGYKAINIKGTKLEESFVNQGNDVDFSRHEGDVFEWCGDESDKVCNFPFIDGATPVFSSQVVSIIQSLITNCSQTFNIYVGGENYVIVEANLLEGILNKEKSSIRYFKDGRIMNVKKYVFNNADTFPAVFRIPECKTFTFVTENVIESLKNAKMIEGLNYELCDVI